MLVLLIVLWVDIVIFLILGVFLINGKGTWMISGYNTMSKEEKEKCNIKKISLAIGKFFIIIAVLMAILSFIIQYAIKNNSENIIGYAAGGFGFVIFVMIVVLIIFLQKYNEN